MISLDKYSRNDQTHSRKAGIEQNLYLCFGSNVLAIFIIESCVFKTGVSIFPGAVFLERVKCILISFIVQCVNIISVSKVSVYAIFGGVILCWNFCI